MKKQIGLQKPTAEEIILQTGTKRDKKMWVEDANIKTIEEEKRRSISLESEKNRSLSNSPDQKNTSKVIKPREKLQSQLHTIMPMEIVRSQPFFSQKSHLLRDQLEEYVHGFPATKAHRQIIARAYDMQPDGDINEVDNMKQQEPVVSEIKYH